MGKSAIAAELCRFATAPGRRFAAHGKQRLAYVPRAQGLDGHLSCILGASRSLQNSALHSETGSAACAQLSIFAAAGAPQRWTRTLSAPRLLASPPIMGAHVRYKAIRSMRAPEASLLIAQRRSSVGAQPFRARRWSKMLRRDEFVPEVLDKHPQLCHLITRPSSFRLQRDESRRSPLYRLDGEGGVPLS